MILRSTVIVALCLALFGHIAPAQAGEPVKLSLADAVKLALDNRGDLKAARLAVKVEEAENAQVNARFMP